MPVRHAVLGLLAQRPRHGYELRAAFEAVMGGQENWDLKPAQIYTTVARLQSAGLIAEERVEQDAGPEKRIYALTPQGSQALHEWLADGIVQAHQRDELFAKLMISLVSGAADPFEVLSIQRTFLYRELHGITAQRIAADPASELAKILLLDKAAMHLEADLRWLEMTEARLEEIRRQPLPEPEPKARGRPRKTRE